MSFQEELEPKVAEIERQAREHYDLYLGGLGFMVDEAGAVVRDPDFTGMVPPEVTEEGEQGKYDDFLALLDAIRGRFERHYDLNPTELDTIVDTLGGKRHGVAPTAVWQAHSVYERIHYADDQWMRPLLQFVDEDWTSDTATKFYDRILDPFHRAAEFQLACTKILGMAAQAAHDGMTKVQDDLLAIADAAIDEFEHGGGGGGGFFTAVSFIAGAVGLFLPTGASQVAGVISLGSGIASLFAGVDDSEESREWNVDGPNAPMILESLQECLLALEEEIDRKDRQMADALEQDLDSREAFDSPELRLEELPSLAGPDAFGTVNARSVPGGPIAEDKVVVRVVQVYEAGYRNLPSAAHQYEAATSDLVEPLSSAFAGLYFRTESTFRQARARLRSAVSDIRWYLEDAGEALVEIATGYELTDEQAAETLRQVAEIAPPPHTMLVRSSYHDDNPVAAAYRGAV